MCCCSSSDIEEALFLQSMFKISTVVLLLSTVHKYPVRQCDSHTTSTVLSINTAVTSHAFWCDAAQECYIWMWHSWRMQLLAQLHHHCWYSSLVASFDVSLRTSCTKVSTLVHAVQVSQSLLIVTEFSDDFGLHSLRTSCCGHCEGFEVSHLLPLVHMGPHNFSADQQWLFHFIAKEWFTPLPFSTGL